MLLGFLLFTSSPADAEQLPIKTYATADGLARDDINRIVRDSHGFLWFCTEEGLSRFDGYGFTNYTTDQGLPHRRVTDLLETRGGLYWVPNGDGLCVFDPQSRGQNVHPIPSMRERQARFVNVLFEDHDGVVWCGTNSGVFRIREQDKGWVFEFIDLPLSTAPTFVSSMVEDSSGALWIGTAQGLFRRLPDGRSDRYTVQQGLPIDFIQSLLRDNENRVWAGTRYGGLCLLVAQPAPNLSVVARLLGRVAIPIVGRGRAREGDQRIRWQTIPRDTANSNTAFRMGLGPNRFPESRPESGGLIAPRASTGFPGWRKPGNLRTLSRRQSARAGMAWAATKCSACLKTLEAMSGLAPSAVLNES